MKRIICILLISIFLLSACSIDMVENESSLDVNTNSLVSFQLETHVSSNDTSVNVDSGAESVFTSSSKNISTTSSFNDGTKKYVSKVTSSSKSYPKASAKDLPRTYVTEETKTNKQKLYVIEKRTGFIINNNLEVLNFYNDVPYLYACIKCSESDLSKLVADNLKVGKVEDINNYEINEPLYKLSFFNFSSEDLDSAFYTDLPPQEFYDIIDNPEDNEYVMGLPNGKYVVGPLTYKNMDHANMYIIKNNEHYLIYISYECSAAYERKMDGKLIKGTYGE